MPPKSKNLLSGLSNAKTRTFVILFGAVIVVGVGIAFLNKKEAGADVLSQQGSQATSVPSKIKATPGEVTTQQYKEIQDAENERRAQEALKKKTSAIPTIMGAIGDPGLEKGDRNQDINATTRTNQETGNPRVQFGDTNATDFLGTSGPFAKSAAEREREKQETRVKQERERIERIREDKEKALQRQQEVQRQQKVAEQEQKAYQESVQRIATQMKQYAGKAYDEWSKFPKQQYTQGALAAKQYDKNQPDAVDKHGNPVSITGSSSATSRGTSGSVSGTHAKKVDKRSTIKAGTVLFGVLETSINSDEPGPVLATIVSGRFAGSRLIGSLKHEPQQETVTIEFNQMNIPKRLRTTSVSVVAIDPDTARTALASDVNHHYLLRYGSLFASSFLAGYGKAVQQQGSTSTVSPLTGAVTTSYPPLDNRQIFLSALGEVGTAWASASRQYFNTPYTVTVDQGTGIGLLFLTDADLSDESR